MKTFLLQGILFISLITIIPEGICRLFIPKISHHKNYEKFADLFPEIDNNTILIAGDSRMEWGVKPLLLNDLMRESGSDYSSINLAMPGSNGLDVLSACLEMDKYPKLILLGTNAFAPLWRNFQFDSSKTTAAYSKEVNREYFFREHSYLWEQKSIKQYFKSKPPFFLHHNYDSKGGVEVVENGNYHERLDFQIAYYKKKSATLTDSVFMNYLDELEVLERQLKKRNIPVFVVRMPLVEELQSLEKQNRNKFKSIDFEYVDWDCLELFNSHGRNMDSLIYQDGSHLSQAYAKKFTTNLYTKLNEELN